MNITVRSMKLSLSESLHIYAEHRVHLALEHAVDAQATVFVRLSDLNGPRGGVDKRCKVEVRGARLCTIAQATDSDPYAAVDMACARLSGVLRRKREKTRESVRRSSTGRERPREMHELAPASAPASATSNSSTRSLPVASAQGSRKRADLAPRAGSAV